MALSAVRPQLLTASLLRTGRVGVQHSATRHAHQSRSRTYTRMVQAQSSSSSETATLACGCFWSPDAKFSKLPGVLSTRVGYTGGSKPNPTYNSVCSGDGHTEAVKVEFDPHELPYKGLLKVFFKEHSPTTKKGSTQYKSAIWYHSPEQKATAEAMMKQISDEAGKPVVTDLEPASQWTDAEDYHQKYYQKSGQ